MILDAGYWMLDAGYSVMVASPPWRVSCIQHRASSIPHPASRVTPITPRPWMRPPIRLRRCEQLLESPCAHIGLSDSDPKCKRGATSKGRVEVQDPSGSTQSL